jgi:hypothetical protein
MYNYYDKGVVDMWDETLSAHFKLLSQFLAEGPEKHLENRESVYTAWLSVHSGISRM